LTPAVSTPAAAQRHSERSWLQDAELGSLVDSGTREIALAGIQEIGAHKAETTVAFIRFLRDAASWDVRVRWNGRFSETVDPLSLVHLDPPADVDGAAGAALTQWKESHRYGLFYWRRGPDFVIVKDVRQAEEPAYFLLDDPPVLSAFMMLTQPSRISTMPESLQDATEELSAERLVLRLDDWAVVLPMRVRIWPIPYAGI
jgi:hypothetical protein